MTNALYGRKVSPALLLAAIYLLLAHPIQPKYICFGNPNYVSCFTKNWFNSHQPVLLGLSNNCLTRGWFRRVLRIEKDCPKDKDIVRILPNCYTWKNADGSLTTDFRTRDKFSKRLYFSFKPVWNLCHWWDVYIANNFFPKWNLGFDTLTTYPDAGTGATTVDGYACQSGSSWSGVLNGTGSTVSSTSASGFAWRVFYTNPYTGVYVWELYRGIFLFDTSSLGSNATVSNAVFSLYVQGISDGSISPDINVYASTPASNNVLVAADYSRIGTTAYATAIAVASLTTSAYNSFTFNSTGLAAVSKTGLTKLGTRNANYELTGTTPSLSSGSSALVLAMFADQTGTANDPKLVVTYTSGYSNGVIIISE